MIPFRTSVTKIIAVFLLVDNLYLDTNGILHQAKQGNSSEKDMIAAFVKYVEELVNIVTPSKYKKSHSKLIINADI